MRWISRARRTLRLPWTTLVQPGSRRWRRAGVSGAVGVVALVAVVVGVAAGVIAPSPAGANDLASSNASPSVEPPCDWYGSNFGAVVKNWEVFRGTGGFGMRIAGLLASRSRGRMVERSSSLTGTPCTRRRSRGPSYGDQSARMTPSIMLCMAAGRGTAWRASCRSTSPAWTARWCMQLAGPISRTAAIRRLGAVSALVILLVMLNPPPVVIPPVVILVPRTHHPSESA